jgi:hypothetical protein
MKNKNEYWSSLEETAKHIGVNKGTIRNRIEGGNLCL